MAFTKISIAALIFQSFCSPVICQNVFDNPPAATPNLDFSRNDVFYINSSELLQWTTNHQSYNVLLWQQNLTADGPPVAGPSVFAKATPDPEVGNVKWTVQSYGFDLACSNVFYLALTPTENATAGFESHFFNITTRSPTVSPTSLPSPSSATGNSTAAPTSSAVPNSSSQSLKIGLGVGLPLVCIFGAAVGYLVAVRRVKKGSSRGMQGPEQGSERIMSVGCPWTFDHAMPEAVKDHLHGTIHEAPGVWPIAEVPSGRKGEMVLEKGLPDTPSVSG